MAPHCLFIGAPCVPQAPWIECLRGTEQHRPGDHAAIYVDLAMDSSSQNEAAQAVTSTLKQSEAQKLIFLVRLENGRVLSEDIAIIAVVMGSIDQKDTPFSVIVYETEELQRVDSMLSGEVCKRVRVALSYAGYNTPHVLFVPKLATNDCNSSPDNVVGFIEKDSPIAKIPATQVKAIHFEGFEDAQLAVQEQRLLAPTAELVEFYEPGLFWTTFEACVPAEEVHLTLQKALRDEGIEYTCCPKWVIIAFTLFEAEEIYFSIQVYRWGITKAVQVGFKYNYLPQESHFKFRVLMHRIHKYCFSIDRRMVDAPESVKQRIVDWSRFGQEYPASCSEKADKLGILVANLAQPSCPRTMLTMMLKNLCQYEANRRTLLDQFKDEFVAIVQSLLNDPDQHIVRFAVYMIQNFAKNPADLKALELPELTETLEKIVVHSTRPSTQKLAYQLYETVVDWHQETSDSD